MPHAFRARALSAIGAFFLLLTCARSFAAPLAPGGAMLAPPEPDPFLGVAIASTFQPFATPPGPGAFSGSLITTVIRDDPSNPFANVGNPNPALHGLTFVYELHNNATSLTALGRMTNIDFSTFLTDVSFQAPPSGLAPTSVDRSFGPGATIGWSFTGAPLGLG